MQKSFIFDINKCTGCQACQIACLIENELAPPINWREVHTFNEFHVPDMPSFHLSLACNHCIEPPCMMYCPALAYSKDPVTGAVTIDCRLCIGCKYCSWVCPYDAPKFNHLSGLMEKCTFCAHRLDEGHEPACVALCPTGSLQFGDYVERENAQSIPGFTETDIQPAIQFIPLRQNQQVPECSAPTVVESLEGHLSGTHKRLPPKITLNSEWTLVVFTLAAAILIGQISANLLTTVKMKPHLFLGMGLFAMVLSMLHLGKKARAYRAILNWRRSWLSREVIFYSGFLVMSAGYLYLAPTNKVIAGMTALIGFLALISMDGVYRVINPEARHFHSARVILTGLFFMGYFSQNPIIFVGIGFLKFLLYINRKFQFKRNHQETRTLLSSLKIVFGFCLPMVLWLTDLKTFSDYILLSVVFGEIIDRSEFYLELNISTPAVQMANDFRKMMQNKL